MTLTPCSTCFFSLSEGLELLPVPVLLRVLRGPAEEVLPRHVLRLRAEACEGRPLGRHRERHLERTGGRAH